MSRFRLLLAAALIALSFARAAAQTTGARPERGVSPGGTYAVSDVESGSLTGGNVNLSIPLASLPPVAGGRLSFTLSAVYNSKLWDVAREERRAPGFGYNTYPVDVPRRSDLGGWRITGEYVVRFREATEDYKYAPPTLQSETDSQDWVNMQQRWYKAVLITPDGAERELRPSQPSGVYTLAARPREYLNGYYSHTPDNTGVPARYYTIDGSHLSVVVNPAGSSTRAVIYLPDGMRVELYNAQLNAGVTQRIIDPYGNSIKFFSANGVSHIQDERTERGITISHPAADVTRVTYQAVGGVVPQHIDIHLGTTTVRGKLYKVNDWDPNIIGETGQGGDVCKKYVALGAEQSPAAQAQTTLEVIRKIVLPATEPGRPGREFTFEYESDVTETVTTEGVQWGCGTALTSHTRLASRGMGALSRMATPSGATVEYDYTLAAHHDFGDNPDEMTEEALTTKRVKYADESAPNGVATDIWTYDINPRAGTGSVTSPGGSTDVEVSYPQDPRWGAYGAQSAAMTGLTYRSTRSGRVMTERHWKLMPFAGANTSRTGAVSALPVVFNPVVDAEYTTLLEPDASGTPVPVRMSAKTYKHDYNGNVTEVKEYDWFDPIPASGRDAAGVPTGVPTGAVLLRTTTATFHNSPISDSSGEVYAKRALPAVGSYVLNAVKETAVGPSITQFSYDGEGYGVTPTKGYVTRTSSFDDQGDSDASNNRWVTTERAFDPTYGNVISSKDANGNVTTYTYGDATHALPTKVEADPLNDTGAQATLTAYDFSTGLVVSTTDPNGQATYVDYTNQLLGSVDPFGRPGVVTGPAVAVGGVSQRRKVFNTYEDHLRRVTVESDLRAEGDRLLKSRVTSDELGRAVLSEQSEDGVDYTVSARTAYEPGGRVTFASNPMRATAADTDGWTRATRDEAGRVVEVTTFGGRAKPTPASQCGAAAGCTGVVTTAYYAEFTTVTDQAGKVRRSKTDALGRLVRVDEPSDSNNTLGGHGSPTQPTAYGYDALGNLTQVRQGGALLNSVYTGGQTRAFTYGSLSRLSSATNPEGGEVSYEYDKAGNLKKRTDARGVVTSYNYDGLSRATARDYSDQTPDVTYTYEAAGVANSKGRLTQVSSSVSAYNYTGYDALGRVTASSQTTGGRSYAMAYEYDLAGNLRRETYPSGRVVATEYDAAGRVAGVQNHATGQYYAGGDAGTTNRISYTAGGAPAAVRLGNGLWEQTLFNSRQQPTQISLGTVANNSSVLRLDYTYGVEAGGTLDPTRNNGNLQSQTITAPGAAALAQTYYYDELNRLKAAEERTGATPVWKQVYSYDQYGNRGFGAGTTSPDYSQSLTDPVGNPVIDPTNNRIKTDAPGQGNYAYDAAGNLAKTLVTPQTYRDLSYDAENKQIKSDGGSAAGGADYIYDGDGNRVKKVVNAAVTIFVYDAAGRLVAEYSNTVEANGPRYLTQDHLGSTRVGTDEDGAVQSRHDYFPFGEELQAGAGGRTQTQGYSQFNGVRQGFTGYEKDGETGLNFAQNRYHSPAQGRFISVDPENAGASKADPQSWNGYAYAGNNPLKYTDPLGLWKQVACSGGASQCWESDREDDTYESLAKLIGTRDAAMLAEFFQNQEITRETVLDTSEYRIWWIERKFEQIGQMYDNGPPVMSGGIRFPSGGAQSGGVFSRFWNWLRGGSGSRGSTFAGGVTREALERAAADPGPTIQVVTKLTQAPQAGRELSVAAGENAGALANAARVRGQVYTANIPKALIETLRTAGLVRQSVTRMGGSTAVEYRFEAEAAEFVVRFFK